MPGMARANAYPSKPIRMIVPASAGTTTDVRARQVADRIAGPLGQPVLVENRPGAGHTLGAAYVAKSAADGYTLLVGTIADQGVAPAVYSNLPYDPRNAFVPITQYGETAPLLVAHPGLGVKTMKDLIALARAKPGQITLGSWGNGTLTHLLTMQLMQEAGIELQHVPYRSATQGLTDAAGGQLHLFWDYPVSSVPLIRAGKLVPLMLVGEHRVEPLPQVQSAVEAGLPAVRHKAWAGFFAPAGTPDAVISRLNAEIVKALRTAEMERILVEQGSRVVTNTPQAFAAFVQREREELARMARALNIRIE
ncbi:MAG: tripartite tricarboxylate transporter substrate binding protein [Burkholderiales bacterium]|nr:tripartite tricarboxylate transporter substrate binding protein [Burkholderiales bacterium]